MDRFCAAEAAIPFEVSRGHVVDQLRRTVAELWDVPISALSIEYSGDIVQITFPPSLATFRNSDIATVH